MFQIPDRRGFVYILTNQYKTVLYVGVTNHLSRRLEEHAANKGSRSFTSQYNCCHLVYYEVHERIIDAIKREKQLKRWGRKKKEVLINSVNPAWDFLNDKPEVKFMWKEE
jgi:putative endonuclease